MTLALQSLLKALLSLFRWNILIRLTFPLLLAFSLAAFFIIVFWNYGTTLIEKILMNFEWFTRWLEFIFSWTNWPVFQLISLMSIVLFVLLLIPLIYFMTLLLSSLLLIPLLTSPIAKKDFAQLATHSNINFWPSLKNSFVASFIFIFGIILGLPLFLVPGGQILWPLFLNAYVAQKVFPYDILQNYGSPEEIENLMKEESQQFWALGLISGFLFYVPVINLLTPALIALSYIYLSLEILQKKRSSKGI